MSVLRVWGCCGRGDFPADGGGGGGLCCQCFAAAMSVFGVCCGSDFDAVILRIAKAKSTQV